MIRTTDDDGSATSDSIRPKYIYIQLEIQLLRRLHRAPRLLGDVADSADAALTAARAAESRGQFAAALRDRDLDARDVSLVRDISASAGVARALPRGAYAGLRQTTAARDVVHEEITALTCFVAECIFGIASESY
jgi:hypothetical protein